MFRTYQRPGDHEHHVLEGIRDTRRAQVYPEALCKHLAETVSRIIADLGRRAPGDGGRGLQEFGRPL
eukprot:6416435-Pyramimonas_sp.AAC.1